MKRSTTFLTFILFLFSAFSVQAQFTFTENFQGSTVDPNVVIGDGATLTSGNADPVNEGWLRLTTDANSQKGYAYIDEAFPTTLGLLIEFDYSTWRTRGGGADGIGVFLFDGSVSQSQFELGGYGGSLGYAQNDAAHADGLNGGYIGIGIDEFGNFSNPTEGRVGGPGARPNSIVIRGSEDNNYAYLTGESVPSGTPINYPQIVSSRPDRSLFYRRVQIKIVPDNGQYQITVSWKTEPDGNFTQLLNYTTSTPPPPTLKLGWAGSTGGSVDYHEIRNVTVTTPGNVRIQKSQLSGALNVGDQEVYQLTVFNETNSTLNGLKVSDTLRDGQGNLVPDNIFHVTNIQFDNNGYTGNSLITAPSQGSNPFSAIVNMAAHSSVTFTVTGTLQDLPPGSLLYNKAAVFPDAAGITDDDASNDTSSVIATINSADLAVTKSADDPNPAVGDNVNFTVNVQNMGPSAATNVQVGDTLLQGFAYAGDNSGGAYDPATGIWNVGTLNNGSSATLNIQTTVTSSGPYKNTATVTSDAYDATVTNNSSTVYLNVQGGSPQVGDLTVCPGTTAALRDALLAPVPYGYSLEWWTTSNRQAGTKVSNPAAVPAGTYFAFFVPTGGGNYSTPSQVDVTFIEPGEPGIGPVSGNGFNWEVTNGSNGSTESHSMTQPATNHGFVFDIYTLDNSFNMKINGVQLATSEMQFQSNGTPGINVEFADGDQYETNTEGAVWQMTGDTSHPLIRVKISPIGIVSLYASKVSGGPLYRMVPKAGVGNAFQFNTITWNTTGPNHIDVTQLVTGTTTMHGYGYGLTTLDPAPCVFNRSMSLEKSGSYVDANNDGIVNIDDEIQYTFKVENTGNATLTDITLSDSIVNVSNGPIASLAPGESDSSTFTATYPITQADIDRGGVYNRAKATGKDFVDTVVTATSYDPDPLVPGDPGYDPDCPTCTYVPLTQTPHLLFEKTADATGTPVSAGDQITYTLTLTNDGNVTLSDFNITDPQVGTITWTVNGNSWNPTSDSLAVGNVAMGTAVYTVTQAAIDSGGVSNQAFVDYETPDGTPTSNVPSDNPNTGDPDDPTTTDLPANPSVSFEKTADASQLSSPVSAGDQITYTLTLTNDGNVTLSDFNITDPQVGAITWTVNGNNWDPTSDSLFVGDVATGTVVYTVTQAAIDSGSVSNQAFVTYETPDGTPTTDVPSNDPTTTDPDDPTTTDLPATPSVSFEKTADESALSSPVAAGDQITYTLTLTNDGNVTLSDFNITDPQVGTIAWTVGGNSWNPTLDSLLVGSVATGTVVYTVDQAAIDSGSVSNQAFVTYEAPDGTPTSNVPSDNPNTGDPDDPTTTDLPANPSVSFEKTADASQLSSPVSAGDQITYTLTLTNDGNVTLDNFNISDPQVGTITWEVNNTAWDPTSDSLFVGDIATGTVVYTVTQAAIDSGSVSNQAFVTYDTPGGTPTSNVPSDNPNTGDPDDPTTTDLPANPSVSFEKTADASQLSSPVVAGDQITYTLTLTNDGNVTLNNFNISDPQVGTITWEVNNTAWDPTSDSLFVGDIATGTVVYTVTQVAIDSGSVANQAFVGYETPDGTPTTDVPSDNPNTGDPDDPTTTDLPANPSVSFEKTADASQLSSPVSAGDQITYTLTLTNDGNVTLSDFNITDPQVGTIAWTVGGNSWSPTSDSLFVGDVATGTAVYTVTQVAIDSGSVSNQAFVTYDTPDGTPTSSVPSDNPNTGDPDDPTTTDLPANPSVSFEKTADVTGLSSPVVAGDQITYTLTLTNDGNVTLSDFNIIDPQVGTIVWTVGGNGWNPATDTLAVGDIATGTVVYTVTQAAIDSGSVSNQAFVTYETPDGTPTTDVPSNDPTTTDPDDPTTTDIPAQPSVSFEKTADASQLSSPVSAGDQITYTLTLTNDGNVTLSDFNITDPQVGAITWTVNGNNWDPTSDSLFVGDIATGTVVYTVTQVAIDSGSVANQAFVGYETPDGTPTTDVPSDNPNTGDPDDPTTTDLPANPSVSFEKTADASQLSSPVSAGDQITYTLTLTNDGNVTLNNFDITDPQVGTIAWTSNDNNWNPATDTLAVGNLATGTAVYTVTQAAIDSGSVSNQAFVGYETPDGTPTTDVPSDNPNTGDPDDPTTTDLPATPSVQFEKTADATGLGTPVAAGDQITYTLTLTNDGNVTLDHFNISDPQVGTITWEVNKTAWDPTSDSLFVGDIATGTVVYTVDQAAIDSGSVANQAFVTYETPDGTPSTDVPSDNPNTSDPDDPTTTDLPASPSVRFDKTADVSGLSNPVKAGDQITYTLTLTNDGNVTLSDFNIIDPQVGTIAWTVGGNGWNPATDTLAVGDIATGTVVYTVTQAAIDSGSVSNQAFVDYETPDGTPTTDIPSDNPNTGDPDDPTNTDLPANPSVNFEKTADESELSSPVAAGDQITYTLTLTNDGNVTLDHFNISDPQVGTITWEVNKTAWDPTSDSLFVGDIATGTVVYTVTQAAIDSGSVSNQAFVTYEAPDGTPTSNVPSDNPNTGDPDDPTTTDLPANPSVSFEKTADVSSLSNPVVAGDQITYTLTLTNDGNVTLDNFNISDPQVGTITWTVNGNNWNPTLDTLAVGDVATGTVVYTVTQAAIDSGSVSNQAFVDYETPDGTPTTDIPSDNPNTGDPDDPTNTDLPANPSVNFEKTADESELSSPVAAGDQITYTLTLTNDGNVTLDHFNISDPQVGTITWEVNKTAWDPTSDSLFVGDIATGTVVYTVDQAAIDSGSVSNQAFVTYETPDGTPTTDVPSNDPTTTDPDDPTTTDIPAQPSVNFEKTADASQLSSPVSAGDQITYTLTLTNDGNVTLSDFNITDPQVGTISWTVGGNSWDPAADTLAVGNIATGTVVYTVTQVAIDSGSVSNQAFVTYETPDGTPITDVPSNDPTTTDPDDPTTTDIPAQPSVNFEKTADASELSSPVSTGDQITYTLTLTNDGNVTLNNFNITDPQVGTIAWTVNNTAWDPTTDTLAVGDIATGTAVYTATQAAIDSGSVSNQAFVGYETPDGTPSTDVPSDNPNTGDPDDPTNTNLPANPSVSFEKTADESELSSPVKEGDQITYTLTLTNNGNVTLKDFNIKDSQVGTIAWTVNNTTWNPVTDTLAVGDIATGTVVYTITQAAIDSGSVSNQAFVDYETPDGTPTTDVPSDNPNTGDPDDPTTTDIPANPSVQFEKTADATGLSSPVAAGDQITYTLTLTNDGNITLHNFNISDPQVGAITWTVGGNSWNPGTDSLLVGSVATGTVVYTVDQAAIDSGSVSNQAFVTYEAPDGTPISNVPSDNPNTGDPGDPTTTDLPANPSVSFEKTADVSSLSNPVSAGDQITYTLTLTNDGNVTLSDFNITDPQVGAIAWTVGGNSWNPTTDTLAVGDIATGTVVYTVTQAAIDSGSVSNQAFVGYETPDGTPTTDVPSDNPNTGDPDDPTTTDLPGESDLSFVKTATISTDANNNSLADVNDVITYTFTAENTGTVTLSGINVTDNLNGVDLAAHLSTWSGDIDADGQLDVDETWTATTTYTVTQSDVDAGTISNQATIDADDPNGDPLAPTPSSNDPNNPGHPGDDPNNTPATDTPTNQAPGISIEKTGNYIDANNDGIANPGDQVNYTFTVENTGNVTLTHITLTDSNVTVSGGVIAQLNPGETDNSTFTATYTITQDDIDAGGVYNQATAKAQDPNGNDVTGKSKDPNPLDPDNPDYDYNCPDCTFTDLQGIPSLSVEKAATYADANGDGIANAGDKIDYTFTVTNKGNVTLTGVTITDSKVTVSGGPIVALNPGATDNTTFTAVYTITQSDVTTGGVYNQATATGKDPDGNDVTAKSTSPNPLDPNDPHYDPNCATCTFTELAASPAVRFTKVDDHSAVNNPSHVGETITYIFKLENTGNVPLHNVSVSDPMTGTISWTINNAPWNPATDVLAAGQTTTGTATYAITQGDLNAAKVSNQAFVDVTPPDGTPIADVPSDDPATGTPDDPTITQLPPEATGSFNFTKEVVVPNTNAPLEVGDVITYTLKLYNTGNVPLSDLAITDAKVDVNQINWTVNGTSWDPSADALPVGRIATGNVNYTLTQADIDNGSVSNQASADANTPNNTPITDQPSDDPNTGTPDDPTVLQLPGKPSMTVEKSAVYADANGDGIANAGDQIDYTFTVENTGNVTLTNVTITDSKVTVSGGPVAALNPGATDNSTFTATYTITQADVNAGGVYNEATATAQDPAGDNVTAKSTNPNPLDPADPNYDPNCATCTFTDLQNNPSMTVEKAAVYADANGDGIANAGDQINYTFTVENTGNVTLTNVTITDSKVTVSGGPIATLNPGATDNSTFIATYTITQADVNAGGVYNEATATAQDPAGDNVTAKSTSPNPLDPNDPDYDPNCANCTFTGLQGTPSMTVQKAAVYTDANGDGVANAGDRINYTFTVANTGNVTLINVTVTDPKVTVMGGPIAGLAPGTTDNSTFTATYTITQADVNAGGVYNQATATAKDPNGNDVTAKSTSPNPLDPNDPHYDPNCASCTFTDLQNNPSMTVEKAAVYTDANGDGIANAGDQINYTFTVANTGNVTLTHLTITDSKVTVSGGPVAAMNPGATDNSTFTAAYTITQADVDAGGVYNEATATGKDPDGNDVTAKSTSPNPLDPADPNYDPNCATCTFTELSASPAVRFTKVDDPTAVSTPSNPGEQITYILKLENTGNVALHDIVVTDNQVGTITWTLNGNTWDPATGTLAVGDVAIGKVAYAITQTDINNNEVENQAFVDVTPPDGTTITDIPSDDPATNTPDDPTKTTLPPGAAPSVAFTKTTILPATNELLAAGDQLTYVLKLSNTGNVPLSDIAVTDANVDVNTISWTLNGTSWDPSADVLNIGETIIGHVSYTLTQADMDNGSVSNQAFADAKTPDNTTITDKPSDDPNTNTPNDPTVTPLTGKPAIAVEKLAVYADANGDGIANAGDQINYTFTVENTGNVTITNVTITDSKVTVNGGPITALNPGVTDNSTFTATYTIMQADVNAGGVYNQATATAQDPAGDNVTAKSTDPNPLDPNDLDYDPNCATCTFTDLPVKADLSFVKTAVITQDAGVSGKADKGDIITYTFTLTNTGNVTASHVVIADPLNGLSVLTYNWPSTTGTLNPGEAVTATATYTVTQTDVDAGQVANQATARANTPDGKPLQPIWSSGEPASPGHPGNNPDNTPKTVVPANQHPSVSVLKSGTYADANKDGIMNAGDQINYTFRVQNTGSATLHNIVITDSKAIISGGPIATLAPGAADNITFTAGHVITQTDMNAGGVYNQATATAKDPAGNEVTGKSTDPNPLDPNDPDYDPDCPNCTFTGLQGTSGMTVQKAAVYTDANGDGIANAGDQIAYTFTVTNTGNVSLTNVTIADPKVTVSGGPITQLSPGTTDNNTFTATYTITQADVNAGGVYNQATATGKDPDGSDITAKSTDPNPLDPNDPDYDPNCATCTYTNLQRAPSMSLEKTGTYEDANGDKVINAGDVIHYSFTVANTGNVTLSNITISDPQVAVTGGPVTLAPGTADKTTFTASYTISADDIDAGGVYNQATAAGQTPDGKPVTERSTDPNPLQPGDPNYNPDCATCTFTPLGGEYTISGTVFNDPDGGNVNNSTGSANQVPTGIFASLVDGSGKVIAAVEVQPDGTYSMKVTNDHSYNVKLTNALPNTGDVLTGNFDAPAGWVYTGSYNGAANSGNSGDQTGTSQPVKASDPGADEVNFGMNQLPETAISKSEEELYPLPGSPLMIDGALFSESAEDSDPNTQDYAGGTVDQIRVTAYPAGADSVLIDGTRYTQANWPSSGVTTNYDSNEGVTSVGIYPNAGATEVVLPIAAIDNGGYEDPTPGSITIPLTCRTIAAPRVQVKETTPTTITFEWNNVDGAAGYKVSLDNGNTWIDPSSGANGTTHTVTGLKPSDEATIVVKAISVQPCQLESDHSIAVTGQTKNPLGDKVFIPNLFSPNNDGHNDLWKVYGNTIKDIYVMIYNQYGQKIYEFRNINDGWDGTFKGQLQPVGVYVYYAKITLQSGQVVERKGSITLIR